MRIAASPRDFGIELSSAPYVVLLDNSIPKFLVLEAAIRGADNTHPGPPQLRQDLCPIQVRRSVVDDDDFIDRTRLLQDAGLDTPERVRSI